LNKLLHIQHDGIENNRISEGLMHIAAWYRRTRERKFTKIDDRLRTNVPHHAKFHRVRPNDVREKRYNFYTLQYKKKFAPRKSRSKLTKFVETSVHCPDS